MNAPSARGLFRATGKKSKPVAVVDLLGNIVKGEHLEREKEDFYPTPAEPTRAILSAERGRLEQFPLLWEPAAGDGAMLREMHALGFQTYASDLVDRGCGAVIRSFYDFTSETKPQGAALVTNPPFDECNTRDGKQRWLYHALDTLGIEYMALMLSWTWPGAGGLAGFWDKHPPARVYLMRWKIDFTGQGAPPMLNAWFIWDASYFGPTILKMLDREDARQGSLL